MADISFTLFRNDRKEKEKQPDYTGSAEVDGVKHRVAAWINEKDGKKFFSGKISLPRDHGHCGGEDFNAPKANAGHRPPPA